MHDPRHRRRLRGRRSRIVEHEHQQKLNWFLLLMMVFFWSVLIFIFVYVEPILVKDMFIPGLYTPVLVMIFGAIMSTLQLFWANTKRSLMIATLIVLGLTFKIMDIANSLNIFALIGLGIAVEYFWISQFKFMTKLFKPKINPETDK